MPEDKCCNDTELCNEAEQADVSATSDEFSILETKQFRLSLDNVLQGVKRSKRQSRERSICITKMQEAIMWLGMDLKDLGNTNPYPDSYKANTKIAPTADGLKM